MAWATSLRLSAVVFVSLATSLPALGTPTAIGRFKDWTVFTDTSDGEAVCYAATEATDKAPKSSRHGDVWFYVTSWKSGRIKAQPSLKVGYDLRQDLPASARIGRATWSLFSAGNEAFAHDKDDASVLRALKRGSELRIEAISERNTQVAYHFSLAGSSAAIDQAAAACR